MAAGAVRLLGSRRGLAGGIYAVTVGAVAAGDLHLDLNKATQRRLRVMSESLTSNYDHYDLCVVGAG